MKFKLLAAITVLILLTGTASAEQSVKLEAPQPVTAGDLDVLEAVWSPDGSTLALTAAKHQGIFLMDEAGGQITTVTDEASAGYRFAWSADGRQILYKAVTDPQALHKAVKLADVETGEIRALSGVSTDVGVPVWFPDGRIGFMFEGDFVIINAQGKVMETIPGIGSNVAAVSHDGQWILYNDPQDRMWAYHLADGERFQATPDGRRFFNPVWSPAEPAALVNELGGPFFLLDITSGQLTELDDGNHYTWSPDGQSIVYDVTADDGYNITAADIYMIGKDGTGKTALTATAQRLEMYPSWSRTGRIAFSQPDGTVFTAQMAAQ
jgi:Tol biopolymer transport system component